MMGNKYLYNFDLFFVLCYRLRIGVNLFELNVEIFTFRYVLLKSREKFYSRKQIIKHTKCMYFFHGIRYLLLDNCVQRFFCRVDRSLRYHELFSFKVIRGYGHIEIKGIQTLFN